MRTHLIAAIALVSLEVAVVGPGMPLPRIPSLSLQPTPLRGDQTIWLSEPEVTQDQDAPRQDRPAKAVEDQQ